MLARRMRSGKCVCFADPPWDEDSPCWQELDQDLPANHLARLVVEQLKVLDLSALFATYLGTGSRPYRPDLMLRIALIETQLGRHSPTQWHKDTRENQALQWAGFGIRPSRSCWHEFYDRVAPFLLTWNQMVLRQAYSQGQVSGQRAAQDGTLIAANASRHRLLNQENLEKRLTQLEAVIAADQSETVADTGQAAPPQAEPALAVTPPSSWMARTPHGRQKQHQRYRQARERLQERLAANAQRNPAKRLDPKRIMVSASDPTAAIGRDKEKVFRPLYNVQLVCDLDSHFILGYEVLATLSDANTLGPLLERVHDLLGRKPETVLVDAGYVTGADLALCAANAITLYGPWLENDFSKRQDRYLAKKEFVWLPEENAYRCLQGQLLTPIGKERREHVDGRSEVQYRYRCAPAHCRACPRHAACTPNPNRGRSLRRSEHEDLINAHKARMATPEVKQIYKLRRQTVELGIADLKEHRRMRRFWGRGLRRARTQVGFAVLARNIVSLAVSPVTAERPLISRAALVTTGCENGP